ncbi:barstar family protein [uncultured Campylobacter sp.]|uniref:barstar family protein n=1 Tax=uncultured Campylobacter sp. TaxID=218934 RepID=UPI0026142BB0|nr:barstar family protein [uncultured Campylobacter sp.]
MSLNFKTCRVAKIIIDGAKIRRKDQIFALFAVALNFELEYVANLDALYDALSERSRQVCVIIKRGGILKLRLGKFYDILLEVLRSGKAKILIL